MTNHTDKELLILAAKAFGLNGYEYVEATAFTHASMQRRNMGGAEDGFFELQADVWSPLTDDGDALRLAVKLGISTRRISNKAMASSSVGQFDECCDNDPYAATRRAIGRAAAAIGEKL